MARGPKSTLPRYSPEQWEQVQPALEHLEPGTLERARLVLVEGRGVSELAKAEEVNRQTVHKAVSSVVAIVGEHLAEGLRPVLVWVTRDKVPQVMELARQYGAPESNTNVSQI